MSERTIDIRDHARFVDYLSQNGFRKVIRTEEFRKYWSAPPDVIRVKDGKPFEVEMAGKYGPNNSLIYSGVGQALVFRCMYGDGGIIYPKEIRSKILRKNRLMGDPFGKYGIEVLFL
jgi:hypothetical protein